MSKEKVLVFRAAVLEPFEAEFKERGGIVTNPFTVDDLVDEIMVPGRCFYMDRDEAETDPGFKQVIPYCVLYSQDQDAGYVLAYKRTKKAGDARLQEKWSLGVGGHINPCDGEQVEWGAYSKAVQRELEEEVGFRPQGPAVAESVIAAIYDPSNEVGRVHVGIVHLIKADQYGVKLKDDALSELHWTSPGSRRQLADQGKFENWSRLIVDNVSLPSTSA